MLIARVEQRERGKKMEDKIFAYAFSCLDKDIDINIDGLDNATMHFVDGVMTALSENEIDAEVAVSELQYLIRLLKSD